MAAEEMLLLTIILRHDQSRVVGCLQEQLEKQGWLAEFPSSGTETVSWTMAMGLGQIVTLRVPASRLREVNRAIETTAWGAFRTEIYVGYDFLPIALEQRKRAR